MWIVDWEYSGMNDPMWDLGDLSVEGKFGERRSEEMMRAYFAGEPSRRSAARRHLQGDVRSPVDALGSHPARQPEPGRGFSGLRGRAFRALPELMQSADFARHVEAVRKGYPRAAEMDVS